eukprot:Phypoly_transcript_15885.p1 GENE.Phypoly_transcript_15885~~Phypoly_transcript_15885.p1  ORF type:complete len:192 (+),score=26.43 Phypoly_transcript_15885:277-852(+)
MFRGLMAGLKFIKGTPLDLDAELKKGGLVMLEFWATWCPPCRASIPHLTTLQKKFSNDLKIIGITTEEESKAKPFVDSMGSQMDYHVAIDTQQSVYNAYMGQYNVSGIPHAFLLKGDKVFWHGHPMTRETEQKIQECINSKPKIDFKKLTREELSNMAIKDLKQIMQENQISSVGLLEKSDYVDKIISLQK